MRLWLRWRIAILLDHLPGQCWADLVDWVQRHKTGVPWYPNRACHGPDLVRCGSCYCGKLRQPGPRLHSRVLLAVVAVLAAAGCQTIEPALTVHVSGQAARATLVYTVGRETDSESVDLPFERRWRARLVVVQAVVADGQVACLIKAGDEPLATDSDGRPNVAVCSVMVPEDPR